MNIIFKNTMKQNKFIFAMIFVLTIFCSSLYSQVRVVNSVSNSSITDGSAFIDASSNTTINSSTNVGKGLLFPSTDLSTFDSFNNTGPLGAPTNYPTYYDGFIVYNTKSGTSSIGSVAIEPGFYYYSNPNQASATGGTWTKMGSAAASSVISTSATNTNLTNSNGGDELVIGLAGTANGTTTVMDLGTTNISADTVDQFRKAYIYDSEGGNLLLIATGTYTSLTNIFVTGNGMMNELLPASSSYYVELYYTAQ